MSDRHKGDMTSGDLAEQLHLFALSAKGAAASLSAIADACSNAAIDMRAIRSRVELGDTAPPMSWEVERHVFIRGLNGEP